MEKLAFKVRSSDGTGQYDIVASKIPGGMSLKCTCSAGINGQQCKHRTSLLFGDCNSLISGNTEEVQMLATWAKGTVLETALLETVEAEKASEVAKKRVKTANKRLALAMLGVA